MSNDEKLSEDARGKVAVVGAGSWGTAVARHLALQGADVALWAHGEETARGINEQHRNPRYLTDCALPERIAATTDLASCLAGARAVVYVVPSYALRASAHDSHAYLGANVPVAVLTKGIEYGTGMLMTDVVLDEVGDPGRVACLSGPNHAEEVSLDLPAAAVVASENPGCARFFQNLFHADRFRVYVSDDVTGVEVCAAYKNVVAIACGIVRGLKMGDNTCSLVLTRGLAEMSRLVSARGGNPMTCMGLAGMGDLVATCTSAHSRNQTFGAAFAAGETLEDFERLTHMVVEGARACRSVREGAASCGVEVPIADAVYGLLYGGVPLAEVTAGLYARAPRVEFYGLDGASRDMRG